MPYPATAIPSAADAERFTRRGLRLARFTVAYNVVEGVVAVTAGLVAGLVSLVGFGPRLRDRVRLRGARRLRLTARLRHGEADEVKERRTLKAIAVSFVVLAAYLTYEGVHDLASGDTPNQSQVGLLLLTASVVVMPILARAERDVGERLGGDRLIPADAAETKICVLLSISTLLGLGLYGPHRRGLARPGSRVRHRRLRRTRRPRSLGRRTGRSRRLMPGSDDVLICR